MTTSKSETMNSIVACSHTESCIIPTIRDRVWDAFSEFDLAKLFPSHIKSVKFISGNPQQINSIFDVVYKDGSLWTYRITELSDAKKSIIAYELVSSSNSLDFSSMYQKIQIYPVTEENLTFLLWETEYSNDVNAHIIQDGKYKKLDYFKDLKKLFSSS
jgi:hypothetical protein